MQSLATDPGASLYVHLPWCVSKCPYCDFNSHALKGDLPAAAYVDALLRDLAADCERFGPRDIGSIFFGGGTPSLFPAEELARVLDEAARLLRPAADIEVTLEANPGAIEHGSFEDYRAAGINRLSIGAQSFDARSLIALGRIHRPDDTVNALRSAVAAGFDNINLDLMYALPQQSVAAACADIDTALALEPAHLSHYQLTIEPNTLFHARPPPLPDSDSAWEIQEACQQRLTTAGFVQYEVSAYAAGEPCRHNINYWRFGDYFGIGAGAHGKLTVAGDILRTQKPRHPRAYMASAGAPVAAQAIERHALPFEYMLNTLRLKDRPLELDDFCDRTGLAASALADSLATARNRGLMQPDDANRWRITARGWRFLNDLQAIFL